MYPPKNAADMSDRLLKVKGQHQRRDDLIKLCNDMYKMRRERTSGYLGHNANTWRGKVAPEYWQSSAKPHNVIDVMAAVLSGNAPKFQVAVPGQGETDLQVRAEKFLSGVFRVNSRRQQTDLFRKIAFHTVLDGGVAVRVYWDPAMPKPTSLEMRPPEEADPNAKPMPIANYEPRKFPIVIDVIPLRKIYTRGKGRLGQPFDEVFHVETRVPNEVYYEWMDVPGADVSFMNDLKTEDERRNTELEYVEWWGENAKGEVFHGVYYNDKVVKAPEKINYPTLPFVITAFKRGSEEEDASEFSRIPFLFPILWATEKEEYLSSRIFRVVDMYANLPPIHRGNRPLHIEGTWGKVLELPENERLEFPIWPGNPPDLYKLLEEVSAVQSQGSFSDAMFGDVPQRMSGYGLSQMIGADSTRVDVPKSNLELGYASIAELIFGLMRVYSPNQYLSVVAKAKQTGKAAVLAGAETLEMIVDCFLKPKKIEDDVRMATLGSQLAALPKPPVSIAYILEHYFGIDQPSDEIDRKLAEDALMNPVVTLMAMLEALKESNASPDVIGVIEKQLADAAQQMLGGGEAKPGPDPQSPPQPGAGMPQAAMGNEPTTEQTMRPGGPTEEVGQTPETQLYGGPRG
jgi:hypothetical protein